MSQEPTIHFYGTVKNGSRQYYKNPMHQQLLASLEGKEFEETLRERFVDTTPDQMGYYRAGIIRHACMESEDFGGWSEKEISEWFGSMFLIFAKNKVIKHKGQEQPTILVVKESTANIGKKRMSEFIEKVLHYLAEQHDIYPLSPEDYFNGKYATQIKNKK